MKGLLADVLSGKTWGQLDATTNTIAGPVNITSTDPAKSNSGFTLLLQLELIIVSTDEIFVPEP